MPNRDWRRGGKGRKPVQISITEKDLAVFDEALAEIARARGAYIRGHPNRSAILVALVKEEQARIQARRVPGAQA